MLFIIDTISANTRSIYFLNFLVFYGSEISTFNCPLLWNTFIFLQIQNRQPPSTYSCTSVAWAGIKKITPHDFLISIQAKSFLKQTELGVDIRNWIGANIIFMAILQNHRWLNLESTMLQMPALVQFFFLRNQPKFFIKMIRKYSSFLQEKFTGNKETSWFVFLLDKIPINKRRFWNVAFKIHIFRL